MREVGRRKICRRNRNFRTCADEYGLVCFKSHRAFFHVGYCKRFCTARLAFGKRNERVRRFAALSDKHAKTVFVNETLVVDFACNHRIGRYSDALEYDFPYNPA